ncbi:MAG: HNH endonuclease signature motif containing protein [Chloroflexi bacterium]|nr:HNH endonuclease signature motif containing protein [Chloroflexota bacterium]
MKYQDKLDGQALAQYAVWLNARAKGVGAKGRLDATLLRDRILESAGRCEWCGADLVGAGFELDHIVSLKRGGSNEPGNLGVACAPCNRRKARKSPAQFAAEVYSESGVKTKLVAMLLESCGVDAGRQMAMFGKTPATAKDSSIDVEDDLSPVAQYIWTD